MHMHMNVHFNAGTLYYTKRSGKPRENNSDLFLDS